MVKPYFTIYSIILGVLAVISMGENRHSSEYMFTAILYTPVYSAMLTLINYGVNKTMVGTAVILMPLTGFFLPFIALGVGFGAASGFEHTSVMFNAVLAITFGLATITYLYITVYLFKIKSSGLYFVFAFLGGSLSSVILPAYSYFFLVCSIICGLFLDLCVNFPLEEKSLYYRGRALFARYKRLINTEGHIE